MADNIIVINAPAVIAALQNGDTQILALIQQAVEKWQYRRQAEVARYPPQNPATRYRRTGTLGRAWTSAKPSWQASSSGFQSRLGNATPYGPFVQGTPQARGMGAWQTADEVATKATGELESGVRAAVAEAEQQISGVTK